MNIFLSLGRPFGFTEAGEFVYKEEHNKGNMLLYDPNTHEMDNLSAHPTDVYTKVHSYAESLVSIY